MTTKLKSPNPVTYHFQTKRLVIRPYELSDYEVWKTAAAIEGKKNRWDQEKRNSSELNLKYFKNLIKTQRNLRQKDSFYGLGVFKKGSGELVGKLALMDVKRGIVQSAYLGYSIFNPYWRQGYAKESVSALLKWGLTQLKLHRIEAGIEPQNRRSLALAKSLGLRKEGKKVRAIFLREQWVDLMIYSITCEDLGLKFRGQSFIKRSII